MFERISVPGASGHFESQVATKLYSMLATEAQATQDRSKNYE
jgi:hypothetical protein